MPTTLTKPKPRKKRYLPHTPNHICLLPPGRVIAEKIFEMGIDAAELARRMEIPVDIIEKLIRFEIPLTREVAEKLQEVTWMSADLMMRHEVFYQRDLAYAMEHPEIRAYRAGKIINQPKRKKKTVQ